MQKIVPARDFIVFPFRIDIGVLYRSQKQPLEVLYSSIVNEVNRTISNFFKKRF